MEENEILIPTNEYQTPITRELLDSYPQEVQDQFLDFIHNVPYIRNLISPTRPHAKDCPRDSSGRIIIDHTNPPILDDMDYFRPTAIHYQKFKRVSDLRPNPNPNSEYGKWIRRETHRCLEGMVRPEDGMWIDGDTYFFWNYCPIMLSKIKDGSRKALRVWDFPEVWEGHWLKMHYSNIARNNGHHGAELASRGKGKAHPYSQVVYTPKGKQKWGSIQIGDYLYGDDGKLTKVIDIPFDEKCDVYKITLKDGRVIYSSSGHLWNVWRSYSHSYKVMSTIEMMQDFAKPRKVSSRNPKGVEYIYRIPINKGADWEFKATQVHPYTFGLLLGDGCFRHKSCYYTQEDLDFEQERIYIPYPVIKWQSKYAYRIDIPNWTYILKEYGLFYVKSEDKFIPDEYKYNSREVRLQVLQGLMDTDGWVDNNGIPTISLSSKKLSDDIMWIARSLGYNCTQSVKKTGYKAKQGFKQCLDSYVVRIYTNDRVFLLDRKQNLVTRFESNYSRSNRDFSTIVNIEYSHEERCKCVTVDNASHCYLIGDFVTTHNSYTLGSRAAKRFILGEDVETTQQVKCLVTAYQKEYLNKDGILNKFLSYIDFCSLNTQFPSRRLKSSMNDMQWRMGYIDLDTGAEKGTLNEVIGVSSKDDESKLRGKRGVLIAIEEFNESGSLHSNMQ